MIEKNEIANWYLEGEPFECYELDPPMTLAHLSKVNIFIGKNNSGKSRLLREIFREHQSKTAFYQKFDIDFISEKVNHILAAISTGINSYFSKNRNYKEEFYDEMHQSTTLELTPILSNLQEINYHKDYQSDKEIVNKLCQAINKLQQTGFVDRKSKFGTGLHSQVSKSIRTEVTPIINELLPRLEKIHEHTFDAKIYIPVIRGLRPLDFDSDKGKFLGTNVYELRTVKDYGFESLEETSSLFTGQNLYYEIRSLLLSEKKKRDRVASFEQFLSETFFDGKEVNLVPREGSDVFSILIDQVEKSIFDLGDGIQAIIILMFPLFTDQGEKIQLFIEEPEQYLHPGLQRKLLKLLMSPSFDQTQIFFTTHSNHFLDISSDFEKVSIYKFKNKGLNNNLPSFQVDNVSNEDESILDLIGVHPSSVLLSNCTIWVEGITDRFYLRRYLEIYQKEKNLKFYQEDFHYSFVEYSGGNIAHWSFLDRSSNETENITAHRITKKIFIITDKDGEKGLERKERLKAELGSNYYCLSCREIENLIEPNVLARTVSDYEGKTDIPKFDQKEYQDDYLGRYLEKKLKPRQRKASYQTSSGTINNKLDFCKKSLHHVNSLKDMSEETQLLCRKIYHFIEQSNPND